MIFWFISSVLILGLVRFIATWRTHVTDCTELVHRLYPYQLADLEDLLDAPVDGRVFWQRTNGVVGLWKRWSNSSVLAQLCQERGEMEPVTDKEMEYVMKRCTALTRASVKALFAGLLTWCMPEVSGRVGHRALKLYSEIALHTHSLYSDDTDHLCGSKLSAVL